MDEGYEAYALPSVLAASKSAAGLETFRIPNLIPGILAVLWVLLAIINYLFQKLDQVYIRLYEAEAALETECKRDLISTNKSCVELEDSNIKKINQEYSWINEDDHRMENNDLHIEFQKLKERFSHSAISTNKEIYTIKTTAQIRNDKNKKYSSINKVNIKLWDWIVNVQNYTKDFSKNLFNMFDRIHEYITSF